MTDSCTPSVPRRTVLATGAGTAAALTTAATRTSQAAAAGPAGRPNAQHADSQHADSQHADSRHAVFRHGVASGDPLPDAVVLWTRVTPTPDATPGSGTGPRVRVTWEVATDRAFRRVIKRGRYVTSADRDHTVKLDARGLAPARWYFYRFTALNQRSPVGRTRTAPRKSDTPDNLRLGLTSCSNWPAGFFGAYRGLAERDDLHAIVHLGDYLYESGSSNVRAHTPDHEIVTLADYRQRHGQYKTDPHLQAAHAIAPWIVIWDDHEVTNDAHGTGAASHDSETEGDYGRRRARAHRAYDEWMPCRMDGTARLGDGTRLYRRLRFGALAELSLLDLRTYRSEQVSQAGTDAGVDDSTRTITGDRQMDWLLEGLQPERARWKVVATSVMFSPLKVAALPGRVVDAINTLSPLLPRDGVYANPDQWDGYTADRRTVVEHLAAHDVRDTVFITGDIHSAWAIEVPTDVGSYPLSPTAGVEFVCTSVTSNNLKDALGTPSRSPINLAAERAILAANPHIKYLNFDDHGFSVLDLTPARAQCDWFVIGSRTDPDTPVTWTRSFATDSGTSTVREVDAPVG